MRSKNRKLMKTGPVQKNQLKPDWNILEGSQNRKKPEILKLLPGRPI
jgi:hypothetical protein